MRIWTRIMETPCARCGAMMLYQLWDKGTGGVETTLRCLGKCGEGRA